MFIYEVSTHMKNVIYSWNNFILKAGIQNWGNISHELIKWRQDTFYDCDHIVLLNWSIKPSIINSANYGVLQFISTRYWRIFVVIGRLWFEVEQDRLKWAGRWCRCGHDRDRGPGGDSLRRFPHRSYTVESCAPSQQRSPVLWGNYKTHRSVGSVILKAADGAHRRAMLYTPHRRTPHTRTPLPGPASSPQRCPCDKWWDMWRPAPSKSSRSHPSPSNGDHHCIPASWWHWGWCQIFLGGREVVAISLCRRRCRHPWRWWASGEPCPGPDVPHWNLETRIYTLHPEKSAL